MYFIFAYVNTLDELTMEKMAKESLEIFLESRIFGNYVSTDFANEFKKPGDTVVAPYPTEMSADRLPERGTMGITDADSNEHTIKLNQHLYVATNFYDREKIRSEKDLVDFFFAPMARALATKYDRTIQGEVLQSHLYSVGKLGTDLTYNTIVDAGMMQTQNNVPVEGRNMIIGPAMGAQVRKASTFIDKLSLTDSSLLRTGVIGEIGGYLASETNSFTPVAESTKRTTAVDIVAAVGDTTVAVDDMTGAITAGSWAKVDGVPFRVVSSTGGATPTAFVIDSPLRAALALDAVVEVYTPSVVNHPSAGTYAVGWEDKIGFDGGVVPKLGQGVTFGTGGKPYTVVKVDATDVWLNRPLDVAVANDASMFLMPGGNYGIGISRNSIQVVTRPLIAPNGGGVVASTAIGENFAIRVMKSYVHLEAREVLSMDCIMGVANHFPQYNVLFLG